MSTENLRKGSNTLKCPPGTIKAGRRSNRTLSLNTQSRTGKVNASPKRTDKQAAKSNKPFDGELKSPPKCLVQTWVWMWKGSNDDDVVREGLGRLTEVFGNPEDAVKYLSA